MNGDSSQSSPIFRGICRVLLLSTRAYRSVIDASPQFNITSCQSENITDAIAAALRSAVSRRLRNMEATVSVVPIDRVAIT